MISNQKSSATSNDFFLLIGWRNRTRGADEGKFRRSCFRKFRKGIVEGRPVASLKTARGHWSQARGHISKFTPARVVTKSPSQPLTARGPGGAL